MKFIKRDASKPCWVITIPITRGYAACYATVIGQPLRPPREIPFNFGNWTKCLKTQPCDVINMREIGEEVE